MPLIVSGGAEAIADSINGERKSNPKRPSIPADVFLRKFLLFISDIFA
jgi:hypothetical protein